MRTIGVVTAVFVVTLAGVGLLTTTRAQKQTLQGSTQVVTLKVPDMDCGGCEMGVKVAANKADGVKDVKTSLDTRTADVTFDPSKTSAEVIAKAITKGTGFTVEVPKSGNNKT
jgi:copper chaperone CopZ